MLHDYNIVLGYAAYYFVPGVWLSSVVCGGEHPLFRGGLNRLEAGLVPFIIVY